MLRNRSRIKSLYDVPAGTGVFLTPSGSDAEYIPLQIVKTLSKGRKVRKPHNAGIFVASARRDCRNAFG